MVNAHRGIFFSFSPSSVYVWDLEGDSVCLMYNLLQLVKVSESD